MLAVVFWISAPKRLPRTISATGTITMDGTPVSGATVVFLPRDREGKPASGLTDGKGNFALQTYFNSKASPDGALPGDYDVLVSKIDVDRQRINPTGAVWTGGVPEWAIEHLLPKKYLRPESGLTATVKEGANNRFLFDLKAEP
jgi:hypothetical protein